MFSNDQFDDTNKTICSHELFDVFGGPKESKVDIFNVIEQNSGSLRFSFRPQTPTKKSFNKKNKIKKHKILPKFTPTFIDVTLDNEETFQTEQPKLQPTPVKKSTKVKKIKKEKNDLKKRLVFEPD